MRRVSSLMIVLIAVLLVLIPATATAELGSVLGDIEWGDDRDEVLEKLRSAKLDELREDDRLRGDRAAMQTARQRALDEMRRIEDTYTELEGERTGYDVSVVAGEFTANNNESMLRVRDDIAQRYFFFLEGELYKLVVAYDEEQIANISFDAFVDQTRQRYGTPNSTEQGDQGLVSARWRDSNHELKVVDQRHYFGTFTMTFSDRDRVQRLEQAGETFGGNDQEEEEAGVSQRVQSVTDRSGGGGNEGVVDDMLGREKLDVEFTSMADEEEEEAEEEATAEADDTPSTGQRQRETSGSSSQPASQDDDDDDLVIY